MSATNALSSATITEATCSAWWLNTPGYTFLPQYGGGAFQFTGCGSGNSGCCLFPLKPELYSQIDGSTQSNPGTFRVPFSGSG